jgi:uncharacterized protein (DUF1015 family)
MSAGGGPPLEVAPFRAVRYAAEGADHLTALVAPPYDVISPEQRASLAARDPHNIVHLILPAERPGDSATDNKYTRCGATYRQWLEQGILRRDAEPAFYALHQRFDSGGARYVRKGFLARLRLREFAEGVVLPHEKTLSGPKADRLEIFKNARANLSPIFSLYPDGRGDVDQLLAPAITRPPDASARTDDGVQHDLWRVTDPAAIAGVRAAMAQRKAFIADGHHRYETALAYARLVDQSLAAPQPNGPHHFVLSFFCSMGDPGLLILPTHRVLHSQASFNLKALLTGSEAFFAITPLADGVANPASLKIALDQLATAGRTRPSFVLVATPGLKSYLLTLKGDAPQAIPDLPQHPELRKLDVTLLHVLLLQRLLGLSLESQERHENLRYVKDAAEAVDTVRRGEAQAAFLLNPTRMEQVRAVAESGAVMPQKSTFFYPKLPSGMVLNPLDSD